PRQTGLWRLPLGGRVRRMATGHAGTIADGRIRRDLPESRRPTHLRRSHLPTSTRVSSAIHRTRIHLPALILFGGFGFVIAAGFPCSLFFFFFFFSSFVIVGVGAVPDALDDPRSRIGVVVADALSGLVRHRWR